MVHHFIFLMLTILKIILVIILIISNQINLKQKYYMLQKLFLLKKYIELSPLAFYKSVYCRVFPIGVLMFVLPYTTYYMMSDGWLRFISVGIVSVLSSSLLIYFLGLDKNMRAFVINKIRSIFKR